MSKTLSVLDLEKALEVVANNRTLADDLLAMLIKAIPDYKQEIKKLSQIKEGQNKQELKKIIHKIHGALRYLGTPALSEIISETYKNLLILSEAQLNQKIEQIFIEFNKIVKEERYNDSISSKK